MDWQRILDGYCERVGTDPNFWGEPVNAITNLSFLVAAAVTFRIAWRAPRRDGTALLLCANLFLIGVGSFLFHSFATPWAALADVLPIMTMILLYFGLVLVRAYGLRGYQATGLALCFLPVAALFDWLLEATPFDGANAQYLAALMLLAVNGLVLQAREHPLANWLYLAGGLFTLSLLLRMSDEAICASFPTGTHFLWHLLNGLLLGILIAGYIRHCPPRGGRAGT